MTVYARWWKNASISSRAESMAKATWVGILQGKACEIELVKRWSSKRRNQAQRWGGPREDRGVIEMIGADDECQRWDINHPALWYHIIHSDLFEYLSTSAWILHCEQVSANMTRRIFFTPTLCIVTRPLTMSTRDTCDTWSPSWAVSPVSGEWHRVSHIMSPWQQCTALTTQG